MESGDDHSPTLDDRKPTSDCTDDTIPTSQRSAVSNGTGSTVDPVGAGLIDEATASGSVVPGIAVIPGQLSSDENSNEESAPVQEPCNIVDLSKKRLARIPENILTSSQHVISLNISKNKGMQLAGDIGKFVNLTILTANDCDIQSLPEEILRLQDLQELDLSGNRLTALPDCLTELKQLKILNICHCELSALPDAMAKMTTLQRLEVSNNELTSLPEAIGRLGQLQELDLSFNELRVFPEWLTELTQLTNLSIHQCGISSLPDAMAKMTALRELDLSFNNLCVFPEWLTELTQLTTLRLSACGLSSLPEAMEKMTALQELDLSFNELRVFPEWLTELTQLTNLSIRKCGISSLPDAMAKMTALRELNLSFNNLCVFPEWLTELTQLTTLRLSACGLSSLPEAMEKMTALQYLDVSRNELVCQPEAIERLVQLEEFNLDKYRNLETLPASFSSLLNLKKLDLIECSLLVLPEWIGDLQKLQYLDVSNNGLACLPETIGSLVQLRELNLSDNELEGLPECLTKLTQLIILKLNRCKLSSLPDAMAKMTALQQLEVSTNELAELPEAIGSLDQLKYLGARNNPLQAFPNFVVDHPNLQHVDLSGSRGNIEELPVQLADNAVLQTLVLFDLPMVYPPKEICNQGLEAIKAYLQAIRGGREQLMCADTINMLGDTGAGKSSIAQSLQRGCPTLAAEDDRTRVMQQLKVKLEDKVVHVNDFGGHKVYHAAHTVFLPTGGLVLLTYDMSKDYRSSKCETNSKNSKSVLYSKSEDAGTPLDVKSDNSVSQMRQTHKVAASVEAEVRRWMVTVLAKSDCARVVVVGTHADELTEDKRDDLECQMRDYIKQLLHEAEGEINDHLSFSSNDDKTKKLRSSLLTVKAAAAELQIVTLSCQPPIPDEGLVRLDEGLARLRTIVTSKLKPSSRMPVSWCLVMNEILESSNDTADAPVFLTWEQVREICRKHMSLEDDEHSLKVLLHYLVSSSKVIWLETHEQLQRYVFYKPQLIIDICKQVLHHDDAIAAGCTLHEYVVKQLQKDYEQGLISTTCIRHVLRSVLKRDFTRANSQSLFEEQTNTVISFMEHFNLIGRVRTDCYVVPSRLPEKEPLKYTELTGTGITPNIRIQLKFVGFVLPQAFFETNLSSVLSLIHSKEIINPLPWKDGVVFKQDGVWLAVVRTNKETILEVRAYADSTKINMWPVLLPVLRRIYDNLLQWWKGAPPFCSLICPGCGFREKQGTLFSSPDTRDVNLDALITPTIRTAGSCWYCVKCENDIPRVLYSPDLSDTLSQTDEDEVRLFLNRFDKAAEGTEASVMLKAPGARSAVSCPEHREPPGSTESTLENRLQTVYINIVPRLTVDKSNYIADWLYSSQLIEMAEKERIQETVTPTNKARMLLDIILKKGDKCIEMLRNDTATGFKDLMDNAEKQLKGRFSL